MRLALSLFAAIAFTGGFATSSSATDWTTEIWAGGDVYKSIGDRVTNIAGGPGALSSSFGAVIGFNSSVGLGNSGVRLQAGASQGIYDFKGRLAIVPNSKKAEQQTFFTLGFSRRGDLMNAWSRISFGLVYDGLHAEQWGINANEIDLGQIRGILGYAVDERTEIGVWGVLKTNDDRAAITVAGAPGVLSTIRAMNQVNFYLKKNFASGAQITGYAGAIGKKSVGDWQFGLIGQAPLNTKWSAYGNFNYVVPGAPVGAGGSGTEQFNVSFGVAYAFSGGKAKPGLAGQPLFKVANNGTFLITD